MQVRHHDCNSHPLNDLQQGDSVRVQPTGDKSKWESGIVLRRITPRSYEVITESGRTCRRNRRALRKVQTSRQQEHSAEKEDISELTKIEENDKEAIECEEL